MLLTSTDTNPAMLKSTSNVSNNTSLVGTTMAVTSQVVAKLVGHEMYYQIYVKDSYLADCELRAFMYGVTHGFDAMVQADSNCACYGICEPPLPPNPDAYALYMAKKAEEDSRKRAENLRYYAPILAVTIIIVALGITGYTNLIHYIIIIILFIFPLTSKH